MIFLWKQMSDENSPADDVYVDRQLWLATESVKWYTEIKI